MRLDDLPESSNVSDQRGMRTVGGIAAGGGGLLLLIVGLIFGVDTSKLGIGGRQSSGPPPNDHYAAFAKKVIGSLESVWHQEFAKADNGYGGADFEPTQLILFSDAVNTGCGQAPSSVGPFYCPRDHKIYLDPSFFEELELKLGGSKVAVLAGLRHGPRVRASHPESAWLQLSNETKRQSWVGPAGTPG